MTDALEKIKAKIHTLSNMTIKNGASKAEAEFATRKLADLLSEHDLTITEVELKDERRKTRAAWFYVQAGV